MGVDLRPAAAFSRSVIANTNWPLPFADGTFDVVTCLEGVEHAHDPFLLLREFARLLRSGGMLILSTPNIHNLRSRLKFLLRGTLFWFDAREVSGIGHVNVVPYFIPTHILDVAGFSGVCVRSNRAVQPAVPNWLARLMQSVLSREAYGERELNSPTFLTGEGLIVSARKSR